MLLHWGSPPKTLLFPLLGCGPTRTSEDGMIVRKRNFTKFCSYTENPTGAHSGSGGGLSSPSVCVNTHWSPKWGFLRLPQVHLPTALAAPWGSGK